MVEPIALDEAFLDVAGVRRVHGPGPDIARAIRARVKAETRLTISVGVATTKLLAKLASDLAKPDGLLEVEPGTELGVLHPLPVRRLWGVGPATERRLATLGVETVGDLAAIPEDTLVRTLGNSSGHHLHALAWNRDERPVVADQEVKSIGHEQTFPTDLHDHAALEHQLVGLADGVASRLRAAHAAARTVQLKVRFGDFKTITRSRTLRGTDRPRRRRRPGGPRPAPVAGGRPRRAPAGHLRPAARAPGPGPPSGHGAGRPFGHGAGRGGPGHALPRSRPRRRRGRRHGDASGRGAAPGRAGAFGGRGPGPVRSWCRRVGTGE